MSALARDRILIAISMVWIAALLQVPELAQVPLAFGITSALIVINALLSFHTLTHARKVLIGLNCAQIILFGFLNYQLHCVFGNAHFSFDREPRFYDWIEFTLSHVLRAADFLDALDDYGFAIQTISHQSMPAGMLLVCMHLTVDVFLIGLGLRWLSRWWREAPKETHLQRGRREFAWLLATVGVYVVFAVCQGFRAIDWLLWPLENVLRVLDVGDCFQVFGWRLHGVEPTYWTRGAGLIFRVVAGVATARLVIWLRLGMLRTWGLSIEELAELLDDPDAVVRRAAAEGLGRSGPLARSAAARLVPLMRDLDPEVQRTAAQALGRIGCAAPHAVARLIDAVWLGNAEMRLAAAKALGELGSDARPALRSLVTLLKVSDADTQPAITQALAIIAPDIVARLPAKLGRRKRRRRRGRKQDAWTRSVKAAQVRRETENAARALLIELRNDGFFDDERDIQTICEELSLRRLDVQPMWLCLPLLSLISDGLLLRCKNPNGDWLYRRPR